MPHCLFSNTIHTSLYQIQERLQVEVDDVWRQVGSRPLEYFDLTKFKFMTRCIHETLRMWPAVANGTFRVTHYDDYCHGGKWRESVPSQGHKINGSLKNRSDLKDRLAYCRFFYLLFSCCNFVAFYMATSSQSQAVGSRC